MSKTIIISKIGNNYRMTIDGIPRRFTKETSDLLTGGDIVSSFDRVGVLTNRDEPVTFYLGSVGHSICFGVGDPLRKFPDDFENIAEEVKRRIKLVRDTFINAEAEKKVWQFEIE